MKWEPVYTGSLGKSQWAECKHCGQGVTITEKPGPNQVDICGPAVAVKCSGIHPDKLYWATFNGIEIRLPGQCVLDCSRPGQDADEAVVYWTPKVQAIAAADDFNPAWVSTPDKIREELREYGAWDDEELADDEQNWRRLVWIAANNIREEGKPDCSKPLKKSKIWMP
jgi:hypothetical protein